MFIVDRKYFSTRRESNTYWWTKFKDQEEIYT